MDYTNFDTNIYPCDQTSNIEEYFSEKQIDLYTYYFCSIYNSTFGGHKFENGATLDQV